MNKNIAVAYYTALGNKNIADVEKYLHFNIRVLGPLGEMIGKQAVLDGVKRYISLFMTLNIRAAFEAGDQAMVVYEAEFPAPIGKLPTAVLLDFKEGLISKIELFFDASKF